MRLMGYGVSLFASSEDFLQSERVADSSCLIVDMHMPGLSGAELQQHLIAKGNRTPIIFVSALANEKTKAMALEAGAIGFLDKPFREQRMIDFVDATLQRRES